MTKQKQASIQLDTSIVRVGAYKVSLAELTVEQSMSIRDISNEAIVETAAMLEDSAPSQIIDVAKINGELLVINGIRTILALKSLQESGKIVDVEVLVHEINGSDLALIMHMVNSPGESELKPMEMALAYKRAAEQGVKQCDIAKLFKVTSVQVSNYLVLADASVELQSLIKEGVISPTKAHQSIRKIGEVGTLKLAISMQANKPSKGTKNLRLIKTAISADKVCSAAKELGSVLSKLNLDGEEPVKVVVSKQLANSIQAAVKAA